MADRNRAYDAKRRQDSPTRALYGTQRWRRRSGQQLRIDPLCAMCLAKGRTEAASIADHDPPHRGDVDAFWNGPLQSLCKHCHDQIKQREEARGYSDSIDPDGWPTDPRHPANAHVGAPVGRQTGIPRPPGGAKSLGPVAPRPAAPFRAQNRKMETGGRTHD